MAAADRMARVQDAGTIAMSGGCRSEMQPGHSVQSGGSVTATEDCVFVQPPPQPQPQPWPQQQPEYGQAQAQPAQWAGQDPAAAGQPQVQYGQAQYMPQ